VVEQVHLVLDKNIEEKSVNQIASGRIQQIRSHCSNCDGQGEKINAKDKCKTYDGKRIVRERKIIQVHIDKSNL
jgi:DnaJ family protein A protein 1